MTLLSAIRFAASAHLVAAEPLHLDMQKRGLDDDCLQMLHLTTSPFLFPLSLASTVLRAWPPRQKRLVTIMGRILGL